jgi:hypothetical protein
MQLSDSQRGKERGMARKYPKIPLAPRDVNLLNFRVNH